MCLRRREAAKGRSCTAAGVRQRALFRSRATRMRALNCAPPPGRQTLSAAAVHVRALLLGSARLRKMPRATRINALYCARQFI